MKPEVFGGKKKKNPLLRYNDFVWDSVVGMPLRGAKNVGDLAKRAGKHALKVATHSDYSKEDLKRAKELREKRLAKEKNRQPAPKPKSESKPKPKTESKPETKSKETKPKTNEKSEKAAWLKKTRNSPAAQSGAFTDDERWALQQKHRKWKADRASGKLKKKRR